MSTTAFLADADRQPPLHPGPAIWRGVNGNMHDPANWSTGEVGVDLIIPRGSHVPAQVFEGALERIVVERGASVGTGGRPLTVFTMRATHGGRGKLRVT